MSYSLHPPKYFVPALPSQLVLIAATCVVKGLGGTGKTTALLGVGNHSQVWERFRDAVWFISLGQHGKPSALLQNLETVVRDVVGDTQADKIAELSKIQNLSSAVAQAIRLLNHRAVLLLIDDVWADEESPEVGQSTIFSLVQDCIRRVRANPGDLRLVVSTRDANVATLVPGRCRVVAAPFKSRDASARAMLCSYAEASLNEIDSASSLLQQSFGAVLDSCAGLQLALTVAGCGVRTRMEFGDVGIDEVWSSNAVELVDATELLKTSHTDHPALYAMLESSLKHLAACLGKDGIVLSDDARIVFSLIGVLKKQECVPLSVVQCIRAMSQKLTLQLCRALARMHMVSLESRDGVWWISAHDLILEYCRIVLDEVPGRKSFAHRMTAEGLEQMLLGIDRLEVTWGGCAAFWKLSSTCLDMDMGAREYTIQNIARHQVEAGGKYGQRLLNLLTDFRWVEARMQQSKDGNDLSGYIEDVRTLMKRGGEDLSEEVQSGLELLSDAASLSRQYVVINPRELAFQLEGRLNIHACRNAVVRRFLWSLGRYAKRPWLKPGKGVLRAAGGAVVLSASLPKALSCIAVLPNGDDVVVGREGGYMSVFSIRYASELYKLGGHCGFIKCFAMCYKTNRIFSCGQDRTIRSWLLGTGHGIGQVVLRHERELMSLAVMAGGNRIVFGEEEGLLAVCNSTSGQVMYQWRGHSDTVYSLAIRKEDGMIVSGSCDGTIGRWKCEGDREIGSRIAVGNGEVNSVVVSRDGKRIAYGADKKVVVLDASSGNVLRECHTKRAALCVRFGYDDETVHFGRQGGTISALTPDGHVVNDVRAHSRDVFGIAMCRESRLIVSVSFDSTLSVQSLERFNSSVAAEANERYELMQLLILPDRKRILYSWSKGPKGLQLLNIGTISPETVLSEEAMVEASSTIVNSDMRVTTIAASRDGRCAVAGTWKGEIEVYSTDTWRPRHVSLRRLRGCVLSMAVSNDGAFLAAGSNEGDVALFRLENGSNVPLPSSNAVDGMVMNVAFSEENTSLVAVVRNYSETTGMLHVWKRIDRAADVGHIALPFSRISKWKQPQHPTSLIASSTHIATRYVVDSEACVYAFADDQYSLAAAEDDDDSGLLQLSTREHRAFALEDMLYIEPFGRAITYRKGSDNVVLGTLETSICQSFRPEQWTFNDALSLFIAGGFGTTLLSAILVKERISPEAGEQEKDPGLPPIHSAIRPGVGNMPLGAVASQYTAFISHAGPDKRDLALPLYRRLVELGIETFVDKEGLRPGDVGAQEMVLAMRTADVGVFITSPEFACREWPMRELSCFLSRRKEAISTGGKPPVVLPVFYRLDVHECRRNDLFNMSNMIQVAGKEGFYSAERQKDMPIEKVLELLKRLASFTGIANEEGVVNDAICTGSRMENQRRRRELLERIVKAVVEARARRDRAAALEARSRQEEAAERLELILDAEAGQDGISEEPERSDGCGCCVIA